MTKDQAQRHPEVLKGTRRAKRDGSKLGGWTTRDIKKLRLANTRYRNSKKGQETSRLYRLSDKGRAVRYACQERYSLTPKGIRAAIRHNASNRRTK